MSASRERKKRLELAASGQSPKQLKAAEEKKKKQKRTLTTVIALVVVLAIAIGCIYGLLIRPNTAPRSAVALRMGDKKLSAVEFSYYYNDTINAFYQNYGGYLNYLMSDPSLPLDEQVYDEENGTTWADYFMEGAASNARFDYAACQAAKADGYSLSKEGEQKIQDNLASLEADLKEHGFSSLKQYITEVYGKGCTKSSYLSYLRTQMLAAEYVQKINDERVYSDEVIAAKDAEDPNVYSNVTYRSYYIGSTGYMDEDAAEELSDEELETAKATALDMAKADAEDMAAKAKGNEETYLKLTQDLAAEGEKESYANADATLQNNIKYEDCSTLIRDWLFEDGRKAGDTTAIGDGTSGYYVLYFLALEDNHYNTVNVRHILISPEVDEDINNDGTNDTSSTEASLAAQAEAEQILADWRAGDATEESFAALADEKSDDSAAGGLYEGVYRGQMVDEFNDWIFDPSRKPGDVEVVNTRYGYHVIYFVGEGEDYRQSMIVSDLREADYTEWSTKLIEGYDYTLESGTSYLNTSIVLGSAS